MSKPVKSESELIAMAKAELKVHAECPDGMIITVLRDGHSWEFRASADRTVSDRPGYPECVAMLVQIGDHLCKQYDVEG
ncbi:hypothetical protein [Bradyrhizobium tunisiense]|jgi:hypothetical protein|uniref:hypothetical protein n=1 Tax=Bradyrhizobium tunisiense TaxID=3278709 RepID=UPI0035E111A5